MKYILLFFFFVSAINLSAQSEVQLYNPDADAWQELQSAIEQASRSNRHVMVQVGGNWCPWCIKLHGFFHEIPVIDSVLKADYVLVRVNYSKENKNPEVLATLGYPQRFGFPVLIVLDEKGNRLHTQDTGYLELDKGYDEEKVKRFLLGWNRASVASETYRK
jgi:thioredoxin-related protein